MRKKWKLLCNLPLLFALTFASCIDNYEQGAVDVGDTVNKGVVSSILAETQNVVNTVGAVDNDFKLTAVSEDGSSSHVANEKFELNLESNITGLNVYDPSEVDITGQFVSPSGELYEMPGFWNVGHQRSFEEYNQNGEFDVISDGDFFAQGNASISGVLDVKEGKKVPVTKISFDNAAAAGANGGQVINKGYTEDLNTVSVWLRVGENFSSDGLFLYFYGADDQAWVKLPTLTTEWKRYSFYYGGATSWTVKTDKNGKEDPNGEEIKCLTEEEMRLTEFTHGNTYNPLPLTKMYSVRIQCSDGKTTNCAAVGDVYISDMQIGRQVGASERTMQVANFEGDIFKTYKEGDLFGQASMTKTGKDNFKVRFRLNEVGEWTYRIVGKKNGETKFTYTSSVTATANPDAEKNKGLIRVEQTQKRNFVFEDGTPYTPIGINVCYSEVPKLSSYIYDIYYPKMAAAGMNFARTWLTHIDAGYGAQTSAGGILNFTPRQNRSYEFEEILRIAEENGIYLQIPMQAISMFRYDLPDGIGGACWDTNPYNTINGGYLDEPWEYFRDTRAIEDTKKLCRYYIARYSYSRNILNWELMNEIGMDSGWYFGIELSQEEARDWADEIGGYMHSADPFDHLVSISSGNDHHDKVYEAEALDFVSFHWYYSGSNYATALANECYQLWQHFGKPVMIGEGGASGMSEAYEHDKDPLGMWGRQTALTCGMGGGAGGATNFWEANVNKYDLYSQYTPAANMFKLFGNDYVKMNTLLSDNYTVSGENASRVNIRGYIDNDTVYAYVMDTMYYYANLNPGTFADTDITFKGMDNGMYMVQVYSTTTCAVAKTFTVNATNGMLTIPMDSWSCDFALIITKA